MRLAVLLLITACRRHDVITPERAPPAPPPITPSPQTDAPLPSACEGWGPVSGDPCTEKGRTCLLEQSAACFIETTCDGAKWKQDATQACPALTVKCPMAPAHGVACARESAVCFYGERGCRCTGSKWQCETTPCPTAVRDGESCTGLLRCAINGACPWELDPKTGEPGGSNWVTYWTCHRGAWREVSRRCLGE